MNRISALIKKISNGLQFHLLKMKSKLIKIASPKLSKQPKRLINFNPDAYEQLIVMKINRD